MTLDRSVPPAPRSNARRIVLRYAFGLSIITYLDRVCISTAAPFIRQDLRLSVLEMSVVFSAFTLAYSIFEIPSGWMGDVLGPRRVLTRIVAWWSVFTMLTGSAWNYLSLLATRFLFGAGEAGAFPNISRSFSRWFPLSERGSANGILFLGSRLGGAIAPALALFFIRHWGWRGSFAIFGSLGFAWALLWFRWYRDEPAEHRAVNEGELRWIRQDDPATMSHTDTPSGVPRGHSHQNTKPSIPWKQIATSRNLYAICGMYFAFGYGLYFYFTWLPTYLIQVLGFSDLAGGFFAGLPFLLAGAADLAGGWITDRLADHHGLRLARCWLGFLSFAGSGILLLISTQTDIRAAKAILIALALGSADLALSAAWAVCLDVGKNYAGVVTGFMNTFGNLGGFLGPMVVGVSVERFGSWTIPFYLSAAVYFLGALLWLAIDPHQPVDRPAAGSSLPQI